MSALLDRRRERRPLRFAVLLCALSAALPLTAKEKLALERVSLPLPGAPAQVVSTDLTGDGLPELVIAVAYTEWDQIASSEVEELDQVLGLVEVLTIVPSLFDHRELWIFEPTTDGEYRAIASPTELSTDVLSIEPGPSPDLPLLALTDDGVSVVRLVPKVTGPKVTAESDESHTLEWQEIYHRRHVAAGTESFLSGLELLHDLDGDGVRDDLLFPTHEGLEVLIDLATDVQPRTRLAYPLEDENDPEPRRRHFPLPTVGDLDGDGLVDLLFEYPGSEKQRFFMFLNRGDGRFSTPLYPFSSWPDDERRGEKDDLDPRHDSIVLFDDLDGDGRAEAITTRSLQNQDVGFRKTIREFKNPPNRYHLFHTGPAVEVESEPFRSFDVTGYAFVDDNESEIELPGGVQDLNNDGLADLVTMTLDFSWMQAVRVLVTRSIKIAIDFHVFCQTEDGRFQKVRGMDLSGKFRADLDELRLGRMPQFAGDFDGDGHVDFVQLGRGKKVGIHRGSERCFYPKKPDLVIHLTEEPLDPGLFQVRDLDHDGLSDVMVTQPQQTDDPGATAPVRLDLYLSRFAQ